MAREGGISRGACEGGQSASSASQGTNRFLKQGSSSGRRRYAGALLQNRYALESRITQRRPFCATPHGKSPPSPAARVWQNTAITRPFHRFDFPG